MIPDMLEPMAEATEHPSEERRSVWHELRETFADRAIDIRTLPRTLRLVVGAAYAQIIVAVILLAVRAFEPGTVPMQTLSNDGDHVPAFTYDVVLIASAIAWATLLTGAFLAHPLARIVMLVAFTFFVRELSFGSGELGLLLAVVLVVGVWIAFFASLFRKPTSFEKTFVPLFVAIVAIGVMILVGSDGPGGMSLRFGFSFVRAMGALLFGLSVVLAMAGGELGDWAQLGGTGIGAMLVRVPTLRARAILVGLAALVLVAIAFGTPQFFHAPVFYVLGTLPLIAFVACVVAVVAYSARRFGTPRIVHIPWFALAGASLLYTIGIGVGPVLESLRGSANANYVRFETREHRRAFAIDMPRTWHEADFGEGVFQASFFSNAHGHAAFTVISLAEPETSIPKSGVIVAAEESPSPILSSREVGYDRVFRVKKSYGIERVVVQRYRGNGVTWQLESRDADADFANRKAIFDDMRGSFTAGDAPNPHDGFGAVSVLLMTAVGIFAACTLLRRFTVSATFFALFSVLYAGENLNHLVAIVRGGTGWGAPVVRIGTVDAAAAACAIAFLAVLAIRRDPAFGRASILLGSTVAGFAILHGLWALYGAAIAAGEISLAQAAIVFLALSWDIVMSGESITNGDSKAFPRAARLGMFLGYVMLVSAAILFFASLKTSNGDPASSFESEGEVRFGIIALGIPVLLTAFIVRLVGLFALPVTGREDREETSSGRTA